MKMTLLEKIQIAEAALRIYEQDGLVDQATEEQKRAPLKFMTEQMTLYNCNNCNKIYNGGKNDYDGALRENMDPTSFLCQRCAELELGYGKEYCDLHGNEFTDFKCQYCCAIALYATDNGQKFYCQPCFNDKMENRLNVKTQCTGGPDCALGISTHPPAPQKFPLGCSLCRSEKMEILVKDTGKGGFNVEQRGDMMAKHGAINNHAELGFRKGGKQPAPQVKVTVGGPENHHQHQKAKKACTIF